MEDIFALALDVGGTSVKSAVVSSAGNVLDDSLSQTPINSKGNYEEIIGAFVSLQARLLEYARKEDIQIAGIGIGMPGPFDYENGISLITGLDKYEAIYGANLKHEFRKRLHLPADFPIFLENDAWAFVRGEGWRGAGRGYARFIGLTLGTGLGSGFMCGDDVVASGSGIPPLAWIGGLPYASGIVDDTISRRGILQRYRNLSAATANQIDVREVAMLAAAGDAPARQTFEETGRILGEILVPVVTQFRADAIVVGGNIAKSFHLMADAMSQPLYAAPQRVKIARALNIEKSAILGAGRFLFKNLA